MSSSKRARADAPAAASAEGYPDVMAPRPRGEGLPGLTRSVYERDHALITPESRVWCGLPGWTDGLHSGAYLASPQMNGALFSMCLVKMSRGCVAAEPLPGVERFLLVLEGSIVCTYLGDRKYDEEVSFRVAASGPVAPHPEGRSGDYVFFPADDAGHSVECEEDGTVVLMFEQRYRPPGTRWGNRPQPTHGFVDDQPTLDPGAPEVFGLRKLLPLDEGYDFNIHVMDFEPGQFLHCNEMHYNQHGMLMLEGQGVYRLGEKHWYHVRAGDAIYMAPYVPQWYAALEPGRTRYVLYKDTYRDPLLSGSAGRGTREMGDRA